MGNPGEKQSQQGNSAPPPPFDGMEPNQDLYAPHLDFQKPPAVEKWPQENQTHLRSTAPQAFPPHQEYHETPHVFPPPQSETVQSFPPSQPSDHQQFHQQNGGMQFQQQQQNGGMQFQQQQQQQQQQQTFQPPMGHPVAGMPPPSPYSNNMTGAQFPNQLPTQAWKTGLFDCMEDPQNAIMTACFPCVTFGQVAEIVDSGATSCATSGMWYSLIAVCIAMPCVISCTYRTKMRALFGLVESPAPDWLVHCFCDWCALCQEYRELKLRGYDPAIGWMGNVAMQRQKQQAAAMAAPMQQRMM